jgi:hypothetical protein
MAKSLVQVCASLSSRLLCSHLWISDSAQPEPWQEPDVDLQESQIDPVYPPGWQDADLEESQIDSVYPPGWQDVDLEQSQYDSVYPPRFM